MEIEETLRLMKITLVTKERIGRFSSKIRFDSAYYCAHMLLARRSAPERRIIKLKAKLAPVATSLSIPAA